MARAEHATGWQMWGCECRAAALGTSVLAVRCFLLACGTEFSGMRQQTAYVGCGVTGSIPQALSCYSESDASCMTVVHVGVWRECMRMAGVWCCVHATSP
jgi:hypothetical protein